MRSRHRWAFVLPAAVTALLGAGAVASILVLSEVPISRNMMIALIVAAAGCLIVLVVAFLQSDRVTASSDHVINNLRTSTLQSQAELQRLLEQLQRGERPALGPPPAIPVKGSDSVTLLQDAVYRARYTAKMALVQASVLSPVAAPGAHVEVFVNLARRLQSLVHRAIQLLDDLENQVEDPDLLKGLFQADHLVTRIRRHAENLAVLGGADSRRQWTTPQALTEVLRSAIAEVEQYSRVKLAPPIEGTLHGHAVADVVHLLAELIENATMFSAPHTLILLRVQPVTAGLVIEVEDRGLGMSRADQQRVNNLLADPQRIDVGALLRDGRLGLYVVSVIARRHGIAVQLQTNIFGGTQAVVVVPHSLLGTRSQDREQLRVPAQQQSPDPVRRQPAAALATPVPAATPAWPPGPAASPPKVMMSLNSRNVQQDAPSSAEEPARDVPASAPAAASPAGPARPTTPDPPARPPLPQRTSQTHLVPELKQQAASQWEEPTGDHDPKLIAAFREGFSQAETSTDEGDGARSRTDHIS